MFNKLKQFKELRDQAKQVQSVLSQEIVQADGASGKIRITMDGNQKVQKVEVDAEILKPENKEKIEKGFVDASNDAIKKVQRVMVEKMKSGDVQMPKMPGF